MKRESVQFVFVQAPPCYFVFHILHCSNFHDVDWQGQIVQMYIELADHLVAGSFATANGVSTSTQSVLLM